MKSHDPNEIPELDPAAFEEARARGLIPIHVICDEPGAHVGDATGTSFIAFGRFVPRQGERITLEDGTVVEVLNISHKLGRRSSTFVEIVANVYAVRVE